jgi:hypothetical protein
MSVLDMRILGHIAAHELETSRCGMADDVDNDLVAAAYMDGLKCGKRQDEL